MTYRLADLVDTPHLRLEVRAGADGLDSPVSWAQTSDLEEPWSWLAGGELLMKNGCTLPDASRGQTALIRGLADKGICGIVIGLDSATPDLTVAAVDLAEQLNFPILVVPYSVGFASIGRAVAGGSGDAEGRRIAVTERVYQVIRQSVNHPGSEGALSQLSRDVACRLAVLDATTGDVVLDASARVPEHLRSALVEEIAGVEERCPECCTSRWTIIGRWPSRCPMRNQPCWWPTSFARHRPTSCSCNTSHRRSPCCWLSRTRGASTTVESVPR
jgi:purine catabolism regulator